VQTATIDSAPADFRILAVQIRDAGLLDRRPGYYSVKIVLTIAAFGAGWAALLVVGNSWATLGVAAFLGVMFTQLGFVGHDAGHQQVFRSRRANCLLGLAVGNALIGLSFGRNIRLIEDGRKVGSEFGVTFCPRLAPAL
jgi:fatty acid desaturase